MLEVINTNNTSLTAGNTIPFSGYTYKTNDKAYFNPATNGIRIQEPGFYEIKGEFVLFTASAGTVTIVANANGVPIPGAIASFTAAAASANLTIPIDKILEIVPSDSGVAEITFTLRTGSIAATLTNAIINVDYIS